MYKVSVAYYQIIQYSFTITETKGCAENFNSTVWKQTPVEVILWTNLYFPLLGFVIVYKHM